MEDKALGLNPDYMEAMTYKNILLRLKANITKDPAEQKRLHRRGRQAPQQGHRRPEAQADRQRLVTADWRLQQLQFRKGAVLDAERPFSSYSGV